MADDRVLFAGYKLPHPLETHILVKVQTTLQTSPEEVMDECKKGLEDIFSTLENQFKDEIKKRRSAPSGEWL